VGAADVVATPLCAFDADLAAKLAAAGIPATSMMISKPYMQRRAYATIRTAWPEVEPVCSSEDISFEEYLKSIGDDKLVIDMLVGDLQRVIEYPARGFAIAQDVPADVTDAYQRLIAAGYDTRLMRERTLRAGGTGSRHGAGDPVGRIRRQLAAGGHGTRPVRWYRLSRNPENTVAVVGWLADWLRHARRCGTATSGPSVVAHRAGKPVGRRGEPDVAMCDMAAARAWAFSPAR
jgi:hypothetical protein